MMPHDVFISYASADKAVADAVVATLEAKHIRCWIAPRDVIPGTPYAKALTEGIDESRILVLVFSSRSNVSPQVMREVERAVRNDIPVIPFRIENIVPTEAMAYLVEGLHWLDAMSPPLERYLDRLSETVRTLLAQKAQPRTTQLRSVPPDLPSSASPKSRKLPWLIAASVLIAGAIFGGVALFNQYKPAGLGVGTCQQEPKRIVVAGKRFLESSILVELIAIALESENPNIEIVREHRRADSPTLFAELRDGLIDIYPEYSGTLLVEHLHQEKDTYKNDEIRVREINEILRQHATGREVRFLEPFGFDNPFVVVMLRNKARELGILSEGGTAPISRLAPKSASLRFGGTPSFQDRDDGRKFLEAYQLRFQGLMKPIAHDGKYKALLSGEIDVVDGYATDPQLLKADFVKLEDGQEHFAQYKAAPLVRKDVLCPGIEKALGKLAGKVQQEDMVRLISRGYYEQLDTADLASDKDAQRKLNILVHQFAQEQGILTTQLPNVVLLEPQDGALILRLPIRYKWKFADGQVTDPLFELERRIGTQGPFRPPKFLHRNSHTEDFYSGIMSWRVRVIDSDHHTVGKWSEWRTVQRYASRWSRIEHTGELRIGVGKADKLFVRDEGKSISGAEIELLRKLLEYALREKIGTRHIILEPERLEWDDGIFKALRENEKLDLLVSRISITPDRERKHDLVFTKPTISYPQSIITNVKQIFQNGRIVLTRLGAQSGTTNEELAKRLLAHSYEQYDVKHNSKKETCETSPCLLLFSGHGSDLDEMVALHNSFIDGIVVDQPYAYYLKKLAGADQVQIKDITTDRLTGFSGLENEKIGFAIRKNDKELLRNLNQAIVENPQFLREFQEQVLLAR